MDRQCRRSSEASRLTDPARRAPATPLQSVSLGSSLVCSVAAALWISVSVLALVDSADRRSDKLTELMAVSVVATLGAVALIALDVDRAIRLRWGGAEERYWAGYADCARAILGDRQSPRRASGPERPGHRPRATSR